MKKIVILFCIFVFWFGSFVYSWDEAVQIKRTIKAWGWATATKGYSEQVNPAWMWVIWSAIGWKWGENFIVAIENGIRYLLGILGIITVIVLLYGGFEMVTAAGDDAQYKKWFKVLKQAAIGLVFIWLAWLFVMLIFAIVNLMWWTT